MKPDRTPARVVKGGGFGPAGSDRYLEQCGRMKPREILRFLDEFRMLQSPPRPARSRLISLKVPEDLLRAFRAKATLHDVPYQTQIKRLMMEWLG